MLNLTTFLVLSVLCSTVFWSTESAYECGWYRLSNWNPHNYSQLMWMYSGSNAVQVGGVLVARTRYTDVRDPYGDKVSFDLMGKFLPTYPAPYFSYGGQEFTQDEFDILMGCNTTWVDFDWSTEIPSNAVLGGFDLLNEEVYIGLMYVDKDLDTNYPPNWAIGTISKKRSTLYIPWHHGQLSTKKPCKILVNTSTIHWYLGKYPMYNRK